MISKFKLDYANTTNYIFNMEVTCLVCYLVVAFVLYKIVDGWLRSQKLNDFNSKYVLVTGCDMGFGHDFARRLDNLGCHVFAGCLTEKGEFALKKDASDWLVTFPLDVSSHESVLQAYKLVCEKLPKGKGILMCICFDSLIN